ncbi:MAG: rod shape-determining protein MreC, partial [Elusimicrobia bacterium]|nr:rod shape-determining protein MreC [Elusimicrobiota bacterium]
MRTPFPKQLLYVLIVLVPFGLLFFNSPFWHNVKTSAMSIGAVSVSIVAGPVGEVRKLLTYRRTWREYRVLKVEVDRLRSQLSTSEEAAQENRRYSRLLNFKNTSVFSSVAARVVARDPSNWNASVMIDRGEKDGISPGMAVVNAAGVIGRVAEVGPHASKVILISDPGFR